MSIAGFVTDGVFLGMILAVASIRRAPKPR